MMDYDIRHGHTYMYFKGKPLYPFGYGLSYTKFDYANLKTSADRIPHDGQVAINVEVKNSGARAGDEVVQLYVTHVGSKVDRPAEELKGFRRVTLAPGKKTTVQFVLKAGDLAYWSVEKGAWQIEPDQINLQIGSSSADARLTKTLAVE
jgi:beta-glucosidase